MTDTLIQESAFEAFMKAYWEYGSTGVGLRKALMAYEASKVSKTDLEAEEILRLRNKWAFLNFPEGGS